MKKIIKILAVLLSCLVLILPVSASGNPHAIATMNPSDCFQPNCRFTYTITYGCGGSAYFPGWCPDEWWIEAYWDPRYMEFVDAHGCLINNLPDEEHGVFYCWGAEPSGSTSVTLDIKNIDIYEERLTTNISAMYYGDRPPFFFSFERTLRQNNQNGWLGIERPDYFVPEFPSAFLPAIVIIGFLGAVLLIKVTREN